MALQAEDWRPAERDLAETMRAEDGALADGALVKVIIESALLTPQEIIRACEVARDGGEGFVKTSTKASTGYRAACEDAGPGALAALEAKTSGAAS
jgi:deoxyribose-phosphate aldolase